MRKLTFLFALLCASVMAFADWTGQVTGSATNVWLDGINTADTRTTVNYTVNYEVGYSGGTLTVTIGFTDDNFGKTVGLVPQMFVNNGYKGNFSGSVWSSNDYSVGDELDMYIYFAYNGGANGSSHFNYTVAEGGGGGGGAFDPSTIDWSSIDFISGSSQFKIYFTDANRPANYTTINVQTAPWADNNTGIYVTFPDGVSACSLIDKTGCWIEGAQVLMYLTAFVDEVTEVTITHASGTKTLYIYNASASSAEPTEIYDTNFALVSLGASATSDNGGTANNAIDNNDGTSWESTHGVDAVKLTIDLGQKRIFNTVQIRWQDAYGKAFTIDVSNDGTDWTTVKSVDETLSGFPYEQTLEFAKTTAQYIRFNGIERGTQWGYNMYSFRVLLPGVSVLTSIDLTAASQAAKIGAGVALTATPKDQNGQTMAETVSYEITPATAGHMSGNTYIPDQMGNASIVAYVGEVRSNAVSVFGVPLNNLALSTNITTDNKIIAQSEFSPSGTDAFYAVDGNMGSVWQGSPTAGNVDDSQVYDSWFVVDLGAYYNIALVALHFEGACSELYHIDFSANNVDWNLGYNLVGAGGINARNDYWTDLDNNTKVRYVRFWSTKAATGWGMKMYEFEVYGTEWTSSDEEKPVMVSASLVSNTYDQAIIAVSATDNDEVARFHVVDATNGIDANFTPSAGNITITGLTHATDYNFTITAKDATGNESANSIVVPVSIPFDVTINLALNKTCEAGYEDGNPAEVAAKANDGDEGTAWVTYANQPAASEWWVVDLGNIYTLTNITTVWAGNYSTNYILQSRVEAPSAADKANDAAWVTLATVTGAEANGTKSTNLSGVGRYIRFRSIERSGECIRLKELRVFGSGVAAADTEKPVMSSASLVSNTDSHAIISVSATDNVGIASYHVVDAGNSIDVTLAPEAGQITVTGLTGGTSYTFVIKAVDLFGNESDNSKSVAVTTSAHYTAPQAACAAPTWPAAQVKALYSPTYGADYTHQDWGSGTVATVDEFGRKYVTNDNGYFGADGFSLNCLMMEKLHYDIWIENDATIRFVPIWGGAEQGITKSLTGQQWNSIDIDLTAYTGITNWGNITQMKIDQASNLTFWVANAYFYRTSAIEDSEAPTNVSASLAAEGFYSVKITASAEDNSGAVNFSIKNGDIEVATGAAATGVETTISVNGLTPGTAYNFNVIALDEAGNAAAPVAVAATTKSVPAPAPAPVTSGKNIVPVYSDVLTGALTGIQSGGWGESTQVEWLQITPSDQVFYAQNFNYAGWHSWGADIDATNMMFIHLDVYSTGMTQIGFTPISHDPTHEGVASIDLTPNAWTSVDIPLSSYAADGIEWNKIFQFKFTNPVGGNEFMADNVYFWQPVANTTPDVAGQANTGGWATFSCAEKVAVPSGVTAYKATYETDVTGEILRLTDIGSVIPAGAGVILKGVANTPYEFHATNEAAPTITDNVLVGCPVRTDISTVLASNDVFCLRYSELYSMTGFFLYTGQYVPAGKAYLKLSKVPASAGAPERRLRFVINETTSITGAEAESAKITKFVENGQLFIRRGDTVYTIQGTRVK